MSVTVSNCNEICQSPTNSSKAKMLYTFNKEPRFPKNNVVLCDNFYNTTDATGRTTSLGFGNKYDFTKDVPKSPPPNSYKLKSEFNENGSKGVGFGKGREDMEVTGPFSAVKKNRNPGANTYEKKSTLNHICYSMNGKRVLQDKQKLLVPGPGTYESVCDLSPKGKYFLAKHRNSCVRNFNHSIKRVSTMHTFAPGPGRYETKRQEMSPSGKYTLSRMQNTLVGRFGSSVRKPLAEKSITPGPGCYRLPSEFGYYLAKSIVNKSSKADGKENTQFEL